MKFSLSRITAARVLGCAGLATTLLFTSCVSSSLATARPNNPAVMQSVNFELQPVTEKTSVRLFIQKPIGKIIWVRFKDIDGAILERFCADKWVETIDRSYNFQGAEEGQYSFEISDGDKTITKSVKLERQDVKEITRLVIE